MRPRLRAVIRPALQARYPFVVLALLSLLLSGAVLLLGARYTNTTAARQDAETRAQAATVAQLRTQLLATCGSAGDLGSIPIPQSPRPSKLAISLVTDNRMQWRALHCPGSLPTAAELGLGKWARFYHLPAS